MRYKVMLDFDLALIYETGTKVLKQSVKRNLNRFPDDFMFELTQEEFKNLRSQIVTSENGGNRYMPFAFTEQGIAMLASVLNSPKAIEVNIQIVRAFVLIRQYTISHKDLMEKMKEIEDKSNKKFKDIYEAIIYLLKKDKEEVEHKSRNKIGFKRQNEKE
jgi:hypothetical protein